VRPDLFLADIEAKPALPHALADALDAADPWHGVPATPALFVEPLVAELVAATWWAEPGRHHVPT
jgi:hypothetical protein